jgi:hypothetical protein
VHINKIFQILWFVCVVGGVGVVGVCLWMCTRVCVLDVGVGVGMGVGVGVGVCSLLQALCVMAALSSFTSGEMRVVGT